MVLGYNFASALSCAPDTQQLQVLFTLYPELKTYNPFHFKLKPFQTLVMRMEKHKSNQHPGVLFFLLLHNLVWREKMKIKSGSNTMATKNGDERVEGQD